MKKGLNLSAVVNSQVYGVVTFRSLWWFGEKLSGDRLTRGDGKAKYAHIQSVVMLILEAFYLQEALKDWQLQKTFIQVLYVWRFLLRGTRLSYNNCSWQFWCIFVSVSWPFHQGLNYTQSLLFHQKFPTLYAQLLHQEFLWLWNSSFCSSFLSSVGMHLYSYSLCPSQSPFPQRPPVSVTKGIAKNSHTNNNIPFDDTQRHRLKHDL